MTEEALGVEQGHGEKGERMPKNTSKGGAVGLGRGWGRTLSVEDWNYPRCKDLG